MANVTRSPFVQASNGALLSFLVDSRFAPGQVFFVCSAATGAADSAGRGQTPDQPLATLDYAIGLCTASKGDLILVLPGHAETLSAAAGVALDVAGVRVIGLGTGRNRPAFTFSAVASSFDISAANCSIEGLVLLAAEDHTAMVNVTAADVTIKDCEIRLATTSKEAVIGILADGGADRMLIENNHIHDIAVAGCDHAISFGAGDHTVIRNNIITGLFAVGGLIENSAAAIDVVIRENVLVNRTPDGDNKLIVAHASTTGGIVGNRGGIIDSSGPAPVTAAAMHVGGNWFSSAGGVTASVLM